MKEAMEKNSTKGRPFCVRRFRNLLERAIERAREQHVNDVAWMIIAVTDFEEKATAMLQLFPFRLLLFLHMTWCPQLPPHQLAQHTPSSHAQCPVARCQCVSVPVACGGTTHRHSRTHT